MKLLSPPPAPLLLAVLALIALGAASLHAEDVYITTGANNCPPSCPYGLGTSTHSPNISAACQVPRTYSVFGILDTATWKVTPTLANSHGTYKILVTKGPASDCSTNIIVNMTTTGGAMADANGTAQTNVSTTAFQKTNSVNTWTLVGYITNNNTTRPDVFFTYASGTASRFYMDAVHFQSVDGITTSAPPARITQILYGNPLTIAGTGPVGHPFALVSSTNPAKALNLWTPEQTNTAGNGAFFFDVSPGTAKAGFFRVITQ
jgi:hypothetical protein